MIRGNDKRFTHQQDLRRWTTNFGNESTAQWKIPTRARWINCESSKQRCGSHICLCSYI